jgi:hypothetical protein
MPRAASTEPIYLAREAVEVERLGKLAVEKNLIRSGEGDDKARLADEAI